MICPSCGLLNTSPAENCVGCHGSLPSPSEPNPIDMNKALAEMASVGRDAKSSSSTSYSTKAKGLKKAQEKQRRIHGVKEKAVETLVKNFLDRDFVKTDRISLSAPTGTARSQEARPATRTFQKPEDAAGANPNSLSAAKPPQVQRASQPGVAAARKKQGSLFSEKIQRIEIDLHQSALPFSQNESPVPSWTDPIHRDLRSATVRDRLGAGIIDALFIVGCWLIFSLVVVFIPDFQFLSSSAGLGLGAVLLAIALSYLFLFTVLSARTLGMNYMGLAVVRFDGKMSSVHDVGLRTFGYCISMGCFGLGFLWAFFDPERLTWHDRISKTLVIEASRSGDD